MALVEKYHVIAAVYDVLSTSPEIKEGMLVKLDGASGAVTRVEAATDTVLGVAGDAFGGSVSSMPGVGTGYISGGNTVSFQNRVSDYFDETKASGKITVYHSGGEFATDQFTGTLDATQVGKVLIAHSSGVLTLNAMTQQQLITAQITPVAILTKAQGVYPSGVPGTDLNGDMALGGANNNEYIEFKLLV